MREFEKAVITLIIGSVCLYAIGWAVIDYFLTMQVQTATLAFFITILGVGWAAFFWNVYEYVPNSPRIN